MGQARLPAARSTSEAVLVTGRLEPQWESAPRIVHCLASSTALGTLIPWTARSERAAFRSGVGACEVGECSAAALDEDPLVAGDAGGQVGGCQARGEQDQDLVLVGGRFAAESVEEGPA